MSPGLLFLMVFIELISAESKALIISNNGSESYKSCTEVFARIGCVVDYSSRIGRGQKIAIEMAVQDHIFIDSSLPSPRSSSCSKLDFLIQDSEGNPARATTRAIDLIKSKKVQVIIGTLTSHEAALVSDSADKKFPFIPLTSPAVMSFQPPETLFQMANDVVFQTQCIAAVIAHFNWRKVTAIYENNGFSVAAVTLTLLSDSLQSVNSEIEHHKAFPSLSLLSDPEKALEDELQKLKSKSNRVFIVFQFSLRSVLLLFKKAKKMGMMEQGYVWIVSDEIASLLDSVDSSFMYKNMQGVIGIKTRFADTTKAYKRFKTRFRRMYGSKYPEEEENSSPSIFALRAYDSITAFARAIVHLQGKGFSTSKRLSEKLSMIKFRGLSGGISFKNGMLAQSPTFEIINVDQKSYRVIAFWSQRRGFSKNLAEAQNEMKPQESAKRGSVVIGPVTWPGGTQEVPQGWTLSSGEKPMKIAIPARGAFHQFVKVTYDPARNTTTKSGFSIQLFEAILKRLPYQLPYELIPVNSSYDEMVGQVHSKGFDGAVGDIEIFADRFKYVDFTQPYVSSGLEMIVAVKPDKVKESLMFKGVFSFGMWLMLVLMHFFACSVVWLIERQHLKGLKCETKARKDKGFMLWLSIILFAQREALDSDVARFVLSPWLFVILVIMATFTASLSSMLTVSQIKPSVLDIETLQRTNSTVGCNGNSFIVRYLVDTLNFKPHNIKNISSVDDYPDAFKNGEIKAAFFVAPHAEVFLKKNCDGFVRVEPIHKLGGFGFAFQKGSPLVIDISEAILEATESGEVQRLETDMLDSFNCSSIKLGSNTIGPEPFLVLFAIAAAILALAFLVTFAGAA